MAFHDVTLPDAFQYGSTAGAGFQTIIQQTASGHEFRVSRQAQAVHRLSLRSELRTAGEAKVLKAFALARRGALHSFRIKDWSDYTTNADGETAPTMLDQLIGTGTGSLSNFQLLKRYEITGPNEYIRTITLPRTNTTVVALDGILMTAYTVSSTGVIQFTSPPGNGVIVTAGCEFDVPVRFTSDVDTWTRLQADAFNVWSLPSLDVQEVLNEVEYPERWQPGGSKVWGTITSSVRMAFNDGAYHIVRSNTASLSMFLPIPTYAGSGPAMFTILIDPATTQNITLRDDAGNSVATMTSGNTYRIGLARSGSTVTWYAY
jgi:uncharacterized protein (TIGR02217 family)